VYALLDTLFFAFHTAFVLFNMTGWIWRATRRLHLAALLLTAGSWVGLGFWKGLGYCPCTDWHWQVRRRLGRGEGLPESYMKFLADALLGTDLPAAAVDAVTVAGFLAALSLSLWLNARDYRRRRAPRNAP
jgi:hypothetical protein